MKCEICGDSTYKPQTISVEGSTMRVCEKCARYGTILRSYVPRRKREYRKFEKEALELVEGYSTLIHQKRESLGLTQEELAKNINEPESVIRRLESRKMRPSEAISRKLEKTLRVSLLVKPEERAVIPSKGPSEGFTLGDMARVRKRSRG